MTERWKVICKLKDVPLQGARLVQRGLAWQDLPGVALFRTADDKVYALLDCCPSCSKGAGPGGSLAQGVVAGSNLLGPRNSWTIELDTGRQVAPEIAYVRTYRVRIADGRVCLDLNEMNTPASRAEWALAGSLAVLPHLQMA
ncbi:nitrite reductase (NAD(P)H) small subunit [Janthinobacterium agaricidamnosum]|uniref:Nitrite reductase [NAD(P)H], small subunit n=1 Tax=Janthinobacterium agaricidamnosum NBRC 102515 = DSM 9628 TaxID=1349767 RepID=W0V1Q4_9BURK|nr:nitrite reductase (NAD(P)H) small subunit [Janthinobacterium agaricidamnosum]CDG81535.1 nitrite reductase [NAD(P)H], small subunit [Janthinobacterium agaricidamnosum NBRC 102515 = DSM 9628]